MLFCLLITIVGLIICFGGISLNKSISALIGFVWGGLGGFIAFIPYLIEGNDSSIAIFISLIFALFFAFIFARFQKICAAVHIFLCNFLFLSFIFMMMFLKDDSGVGIVIILAAVCSLFVSRFAFRFYDYSFILFTAFFGSFLANLGFNGLIETMNKEVFGLKSIVRIINNDFLLVGTIILGILGVIVQLKRIGKINISTLNFSKSPIYDQEDILESDGPTLKINNSTYSLKSKMIESDFWDEILTEKNCLILFIIGLIIVPELYLVAMYSGFYHYVFFSIRKIIYVSTFSIIIYISLNKSKRLGLFYALLIFLIDFLLSFPNLTIQFKNLIFYGTECLVLFVLCHFVLLKIKDISKRYLSAIAFISIYHIFVIPLITNNFYFPFIFLGFDSIIAVISLYICTEYLIFKKENIHIFNSDNIQNFINKFTRKQITIVISGIVICLGSIFIYKEVKEHFAEKDLVVDSELQSELVKGTWGVYTAFDSYGNMMIPNDLFGNAIQYAGNYLNFYEEGNFEMYVYNFIENEIEGYYECFDNTVLLHSNDLDIPMIFEYTKVPELGYTALRWKGLLSVSIDDSDEYSIYFVNFENSNGIENNESDNEKDTLNEEYILPNSDKILLDENDLINLSNEELKLARNEIYARHGRLFRDANLQDYFNSKSWYYGTISPEEFAENDYLNDVEKKNRDFIVQYEKSR